MALLDIVFVILNYNVVDITVNCIKSIEDNIDTNSYHIVLVDNASPNHAGNKLDHIFKDDTAVSYLESQENVGFAKGNNIGIDFARKEYPSKFICCLNNDTLLKQKNFFSVLENRYEKTKVAMIGPRIHLLNGKIEPLMDSLSSVDVYINARNKLLCENVYWAVMREFLLSHPFMEKLNDFRHQKRGDHPSNYRAFKNSYDEEHKDITLHGCCLIFTPMFFSKLKGFNPETFMYGEEDILYFMIRESGMHTLYCPELNIMHLEKQSTTSINKNAIKRRKFVRENQIKSLGVLIHEMESSNTK